MKKVFNTYILEYTVYPKLRLQKYIRVGALGLVITKSMGQILLRIFLLGQTINSDFWLKVTTLTN